MERARIESMKALWVFESESACWHIGLRVDDYQLILLAAFTALLVGCAIYWLWKS